MSTSDNQLNSVIRDYGDAASNLANSHNNAASTTRIVMESFKGLTQVTKSAFTALTDGSTEFSKFNSVVEASGNAFRGVIGNSSKTAMAFGALSQIVEVLTKSVFDNLDKQVKLTDSLSQYGVTVGYNTQQLTQLAQNAGYVVSKSQDFADLVTKAGGTLRALGPDTSQGAARLSAIFNNTASQLEFLRLGILPKDLNKIQLEYIRLQSSSGIKISKDDAEVRESSLQYAKSLVMLSDLTGESKDKLAQQLAAQRADIRYALTVRELEASGNKDAVKAYDRATTLVAAQMNDQLASGLRDIIANGTATTQQGEALWIMTQGKIETWIEQTKSGEITGTELAKRIARATEQFSREHKQALASSEETQRKFFLTGQTISGQATLAAAKSEAELEDIYQNNKKKQDKIKETQNDTINAERKAGIAKDTAMGIVASVVLPAFKTMVGLARQLGFGVARLGAAITGDEISDEFENIMALLGDKNDVAALTNKTDDDIRSINEAIKQQEESDKSVLATQQKIDEITKQREKLEAEEKQDVKPYQDVEKEKREKSLADAAKYRQQLDDLNKKPDKQLTVEERAEKNAAKIRLREAEMRRDDLVNREKERELNKQRNEENEKAIATYKKQLADLKATEKVKPLTIIEKVQQTKIEYQLSAAAKQKSEYEDKEKERIEKLRAINKTERDHLAQDYEAYSKQLADVQKSKDELIKRKQQLLQKRKELYETYQRKDKEEQLAVLDKQIQELQNQTPVSGTDANGNPLSSTLYAGLNFKNFNENTGGGPASPKIIELARNLQNMMPGFKITALNDLYHKRNSPNSTHNTGTAMDFTIDPPPRNIYEAARIKQQLRDMAPGAHVLDEYYADKSSSTTGGHFHVQLPKFRKGGIASGPKSGYKVELHGTEAIIPLLPDRTIPIQIKSGLEDSPNFKENLTGIMSKFAKTTIKPAPKQKKEDLTEMIYAMADKFDEMSRKIEDSTNTQHSLKMYLHN